MVDTVESQANKELSPGQILLQARQQAGMTYEQVAQELYMTAAKVKALETNDFGRLNSDTFVRGYIRAYANFFKLNAAEVISVYEQYQQKNQPQVTINHPAISANSHKGVWQFVALIGIFFVGLWLISVWFFDNHNENENVVPVTNISSLPIDKVITTKAEPVPNNDAADVVVAQDSMLAKVAVAKSAESNSLTVGSVASATPAGVVHSVTNNSLPTNAATQSVVATSISATSQATVVNADSTQKKNALDEISFSFRAECWLEVSDSRGDVLATELEAAGSKIKLVGKAPFDVKLGNAPGVDILLNGNKVDVIPLIGSNVLIMKVGN